MKFTRIFTAIILCSISLISCTNTDTDEELQLVLDHNEMIKTFGPGDSDDPPPPPPNDPD